jgi:hypothetical protein
LVARGVCLIVNHPEHMRGFVLNALVGRHLPHYAPNPGGDWLDATFITPVSHGYEIHHDGFKMA